MGKRVTERCVSRKVMCCKCSCGCVKVRRNKRRTLKNKVRRPSVDTPPPPGLFPGGTRVVHTGFIDVGRSNFVYSSTQLPPTVTMYYDRNFMSASERKIHDMVNTLRKVSPSTPLSRQRPFGSVPTGVNLQPGSRDNIIVNLREAFDRSGSDVYTPGTATSSPNGDDTLPFYEGSGDSSTTSSSADTILPRDDYAEQVNSPAEVDPRVVTDTNDNSSIQVVPLPALAPQGPQIQGMSSDTAIPAFVPTNTQTRTYNRIGSMKGVDRIYSGFETTPVPRNTRSNKTTLLRWEHINRKQLLPNVSPGTQRLMDRDSLLPATGAVADRSKPIGGRPATTGAVAGNSNTIAGRDRWKI
jgi:hypothetical protein